MTITGSVVKRMKRRIILFSGGGVAMDLESSWPSSISKIGIVGTYGGGRIS